MRIATTLGLCLALCQTPSVLAETIEEAVNRDYQQHLSPLFVHFHQNPELSLVETKTSERMAKELAAAGFEVHRGVGVDVDGNPPTGIVALLKNGDGPMVMMRADMDGLPVQENSGLAYASKAMQISPITGLEVPVMHACGHDVHITGLVGTARYMAANTDKWRGTLMLIVQPAEERIIGAKSMMAADPWSTFGKPDIALALHVASMLPSGVVNVVPSSPYAGSDTVDIIVHGVGAHGASPHAGKDPVVIGAQIVMALQTLVSRELAPHEPGVVTVGSFHAGTKNNIISDKAVLQLTVRNAGLDTRKKLLAGVERIARAQALSAGIPEDMLPEVILKASTPPTLNNPELANQLADVWRNTLGADRVMQEMPRGMGAEDFPFFTTDPSIPSVYWAVGGTPLEVLKAAENGGPAVPSHHSPLFKITPEPAVKTAVESTVHALLSLMGK
jgi:amidohydrolase